MAAAESLGATVLTTADLSHGRRYGAVTIENPFPG